MVFRIGLLGGECTGKSVLAARLGEDLPACVAPEVVREFVVAHGRSPRIDEQRGLLLAQQSSVREKADRCTHAVVVADPAPLMVAIYSVLYFDDPTLLDVGVADAAGYDLLLWCAPDIPWEPDPGQRDGPEFRERADRLVADVVADRLPGVPVVRIRGSVEERMGQAWRAWQTLASEKPT